MFKIFENKEPEDLRLDWDKVTTIDDLKLLLRIAFPKVTISEKKVEEVRYLLKEKK